MKPFLDFELEDYEMIKMREKTNKVKRRMSEAVGGEVAVNLDTVDMFLRNNDLWEQYRSKDRQMFWANSDIFNTIFNLALTFVCHVMGH